ncbi:MAG: hypothetical protein U0269_27755 [Polyangiales bacterium]
MSSQATLERWNGFVTKVTQRLTEIMAEADAGFAGMLADPALDTIAFGNAMTALDVRKKDLDQKLNSTFSEQLALQLAMDPAAETQAQHTLSRALWWMEETWERYRTKKNLEMVQTLWTRLEKVWAKPVACVRCGSELQRTVFHKAESIPCRHCSTVNSVTPDPAVYNYFAAAPHMYAEAMALEHRFAVENYKRKLHDDRQVRVHKLDDWREETIEELLQWEALERAYWTAYYAAQARIVPMSEDEQRTWVESRMRPLYEYDFNRRNVWRKYKGMP